LTNGRAIGRILALTLALSATSAWADGSLFDGLGRATGLIAPPADPPDFVKASRPSGEPAPISVFAAPEEPNSKVKSPAELKAMDADLERASGRSEAGGDDGAKAGKPHKAKRKSAVQP